MTPFVYVVGAKCTGKTTSIGALSSHFATSMPSLKVFVIPELTRSILRQESVSGSDVQAGHPRAMHLQLVILQEQFAMAKRSNHNDLVLSDRSGLGPIVYSIKYGGHSYARDLVHTREWADLQSNMKESVVGLCEPVAEWLDDDGERLMRKAQEEGFSLHETFLELLENMAIPFTLLLASLIALDERVSFVVASWERKFNKLNEGKV